MLACVHVNCPCDASNVSLYSLATLVHTCETYAVSSSMIQDKFGVSYKKAAWLSSINYAVVRAHAICIPRVTLCIPRDHMIIPYIAYI